MIILEGPDRCGKTTLAQALLKQLPGWGYRHHTKPPVPPFEYFGWVADARPTTIVDRLHWSERAYGTVYRDQVRLTPHEWRILEMTLMAQRACIVRMTDNQEAITSRYDHREMYSAEKLSDLMLEYDILSDTTGGRPGYLTGVPSTTWRLTELVDDDGELTDTGMEVAKYESRRVSMSAPPPSAGIGYLGGGGWMLIGEAPSYSALMDPSFHGPRVPFGRGRAAEWLWKALDLAGVDWRKGYVTNASYMLSTDVRNLVRTVKPTAIVTVGGVAKALSVRYCLDQLATTINLNHPGYEQRFKRSELEAYSAQLGEALSNFILPLELQSRPIIINEDA